MLEYRVLGGLRVVDDGDEVNVGGPRQRRLLSMLLVHRNTVVSVDRLAEAVFVGEPTEGAATTLRSYVARVRRALAREGSASRIVTRAPGYMLEVSGDAFDVARLEGLVAEGRSRLAHGDAGTAAGALHDALALWRGDAYAEFSDEGWVRPEAERLGELYLTASELLIDAELACGRAADVVPQLEALVAEQPLHESLLSKLAVALYRSGRQVEALRVIHDHRTRLAGEVGLEPSPDLDALEQRILAHDPALQLAEPAGLPLRGYRLGERLGTGAEGTVYAGWLPGVERDLAIRVVREDVADRPEFVRSFEVAAQRVASLRVDAVVPIHDWWREPGGAYLVMRRMPGGTLRDRLERGPMPASEVATVATRIGGALEAATEQGIVHGRLRPESVLFDDAGAPYLGDFGLGRAACDRDDDVHGFSALVAECLTGHPPCDGHVEGLPRTVTAVLARGLATPGPPPIAELVPALVAALTGEAEAPAARQNPYKGLRAFDESDAGDFFGRDDLVDELVARLAGDDVGGRLLLLVGGSGSGKSSAVRAGLVPRIRRGDVPGSERWFVTAMVPGTAPFAQLARSLRHVAVAEAGGLAGELRWGVGGIDRTLRRVVPDGGQLLLLIDQFEELFTGADQAEQQAFLDGLTDAVTAADSRLRVVATLRADFYDRPLGFHRFGALVRDATVTAAAMAASELEAAIVGPATRVGGSVETALVAELVAAVIDEPAALPSLQYTLYDLAEASTDGALTLAAYRELGGVDAAIAARADALFRSLDDADRALVRGVFERLVTVGVEGEPNRRRARRSELAALAPGGSVDGTVEAWARARLLTIDRDPDTREPTVEVAHEALLRDWPRLRGWIAEHRDAIAALGHVREATASWLELDRDPGALYRGARLDVALDVTDRLAGAVPEAEREFLDASRAERERERQGEAERTDRQARVNRRLRLQLATIGVALVVALIVGVVAVGQRERANDEANLAEARELAAAAAANLEADPERSVLLALEAVERSRSGDGSALPEGVDALHQAVGSSRVVATMPGVGGAVDWSPDGSVFVTEGPENTGIVDIRDARTGESVRSFPGHDADINDVAFNHDGSVVATTGDDGTATAWDPATGEELWRIEGDPDTTVWGPTFSGDGTLFVASWLDDGITRVADAATGRTIRQVAAVAGPVRASFSPDATQLAIASSVLPLAVVVDTSTGDEAFRLEGHRAPLGDVAWSPDGRWIASTGEDGSPRVWDARTGDVRFTLHGHTAWVKDVDWSPDSSLLATAGEDGTAKVWRVMAGGTREQLSLRSQETRSGVRSVAFSPEGDRLMGGALDTTAVKVWDVRITGDAEHANFPAVPLHDGAAAFLPDNRHVVASTVGGTATVWDAATGRRQLTFGPEGPASIDVFGADPLADGPTGADILAIDVSPDGRLVAAADVAGAAGVWDAASGERRFAVDAGQSIDDVAWSPDGEVVAMAGDANPSRVTVFDRSGEQVAALDEEPGAAFRSVSFSPDGRLLATARTMTGPAEPQGAEVRIWDWEANEVVRTIDAPAERAVAFDPTSTLIAAPTGSNVVEVWDAATGDKEAALSGHTSLVWDVDVAPDGSTVATASIDGTVRLWDLASGEQLLVLRGHQGSTTSVAFSPDGTRLVSVSADGTTRVWALDLDDLIGLAKDELTRTLTDEECRDYLHLASCPPP